MIDVIHVTVPDALTTARVIVQTLGVDHELSIKWLNALRKFGYHWRPDRNGFMRGV